MINIRKHKKAAQHRHFWQAMNIFGRDYELGEKQSYYNFAPF